MKRCPELQKLSREHHDALRIALNLRRAAAGDEATVEAACIEARRCFEAELLPHFQEEERCLLPYLQSAGGEAVVARTLIEHRTMIRLIRELEIPDAEVLLRFADLLTAHVRFEERELFESAQLLLGGDVMARIARCSGETA